MSARLRSLSLLAASALTCSISFGQSLAIGAIGGVRATDDMAGVAATSVSGRYVVGPQLDIGLPFSLGIEVDALYRHLGYNASYGNGNYTANLHERAHSWEFPMLLKYRLPFPLVKPFVEAGYAPRVIQAPTGYSSFPIPTSQGFVIGGGVQFGIGRLRLAPAVRYTHWNNDAVAIVFADGPSSESMRNQADILLGISWKLH